MMVDIVRNRISELEIELKKYEKRLTSQGSDYIKTIKCLVEIEKIKASINNLYICLGRNSK